MNARAKILVDLALLKAKSEDKKNNFSRDGGLQDQQLSLCVHNLQDQPQPPTSSTNNPTSKPFHIRICFINIV